MADKKMKGKSEFSKEVADKICVLIQQKLKADKNGQKAIRDKIRSLGFYSTDFGMCQALATLLPISWV